MRLPMGVLGREFEFVQGVALSGAYCHGVEQRILGCPRSLPGFGGETYQRFIERHGVNRTRSSIVVQVTGPLPIPTPETLPYWEGAAAGELRIQRCTSCNRYYFYPRPFCPYCASDTVEWTVVSGRATLVSYVINYRPLPPFPADVPVVVALVELAEGPRMATNIVGVAPEPDNLPLGMALTVSFQQRTGKGPTGEVTMAVPVFEPARKVAEWRA